MATTLKSYNPADGTLVGELAVSTPADIDLALDRAREASATWRAVSFAERAQMLKQGAQKLSEEANDLGELLSREMGKPLKRGCGEVAFCASQLANKVDEIAAALQCEVNTQGQVESCVYYDPLGVCAVIAPWNYPMSMLQTMLLPALMAGNCVILKPSEETPLIAQAYVDRLNAYLPKHVLQIVHGSQEQGKALVQSKVDLIAFTGSRATGINILQTAAADLKRVVLELGGKDPMIVLADADIALAAKAAVDGSFDNSGQVCVSIERIYVHQSIAEAFEAQVAELAAKITVGPWDDEKAQLGPLISARQREHVLGQIEDAQAKGARTLCGGGEHPLPYILPTVLADVSEDMNIMQAETFGPVACISRFSDVDEAIAGANSSVYALGATVFGRDEEQAYAVARRLDSGMIGVNKSCFATGDSPWVGAKQSGYGFHGSAAGHRQFAQPRVLSRRKPA